MKNVLVTGANGHVGNNLARLLVEKGYHVRASVRNKRSPELTKPLADLGVEIVEADIMKPETLPAALTGLDGVFQVAAVFTMYSKDPQRDIIDPSVIGGINVLKAAHEAGIKKIVFTSSCAAVGAHATRERPLTEENWNDDAQSPYMIAKTEAEKKAWEFARAHNLNLVTINPTGILGPGFYRHTPTTHVLELALRGQVPAVPPFEFGYVDVRDVAMAHLLAYENERAAGRYIVSETTITMIDMMKMIKEIDGSARVPARVIPQAVMPMVPFFDWLGNKVMGMPRQITSEMVQEFSGRSQFVSNEKARRELGWQPIDFRTSLRDTLDWIKKIFINNN